ncbi:nucleotide-binding universal stress UspA family protein [Rhizobium sp. BK591]|uniref:DUF262 domain-containing protein n=1 Tax=Rhizobium sp. BK591 TaxID=2586985 RepID=UPI001609CAC1|nr:DUF262 domain-containing protein [Rhizobium sp. BK591]MBB3743522.1 nucleotide-binding universal stress UspA family protein [Rhizobium sp. BK591]
MDEIDNGEIARLLSNLSSRTQLPDNIKSKPPTEFSAADVGFEDNSWLARVVEVQGWLWLDDPLNKDETESATAIRLFNQLAPDTEELLFNVSNGVVRMTEQGVDVLESRLARADERSSRFVEALDDDESRSSASAVWEQEWDEQEVREPPNIKAKVDALPIVEFVGHAREGELDLNPPYQREYIWSNPDSQKLIESILRGIPLPSIILATVADDDKLQIVDGKQRLTSILRFVGAHPSAIAFAVEKDDLALFHRSFRKFAKKYALTPDDVRKHYLPFKTRNYEKTDPLRALSGKFYDEIREVQIPIGGKPVAVRKLFDSNSSPYRIPILRYEDTAVRDIHQVFRIYNQQGVKLNAEEIRNAVYNHLKIVQLMLFIGGDRADPLMAEYAVEAGVDPSFAYSVIADMGFSIARFRRTKVLLWMVAALLHPTGTAGSYRAPSTASHIDSFLEAIDKKLPRLRTTQVLTELARDLVAAIELHAEADRAWHPRFRSKRESGTKWEELGAVASLAACFVLVMLSKQDRLLGGVDEVRAVTKEKKGPDSTQNKTQWGHISDSLLTILETVGVTPEEMRTAMDERYGTSAVDGLIELRTLAADA